MRKSSSHQRDIVSHELHFSRQWHLWLVALVEGIAQQVGELSDGILCLVRVNLGKRRYVVERVEEEMRVELVLEPHELCLGCLA